MGNINNKIYLQYHFGTYILSQNNIEDIKTFYFITFIAQEFCYILII